MAEELTVARPYAEAVFNLARESDAFVAWGEMLTLVAAVMADARMADAVANPKLADHQVEGLFFAVCGDALSHEGKNFIRLLQQNGRLALLPVIARQFERLRTEHEGKVDALITTAFPLSDAQLKELVAALEARFRRKVAASVQEDDALVGGIKIEVGDVVIDASVRAQLDKMAAALTR